VSHAKVAALLREFGYSLQANRKTIEGNPNVANEMAVLGD
jgi:hypothetical protein